MIKKTKKTKRKFKPKDDTDRLLVAAGKYVEKRGGRALVAGPIGIMEISKSRFRLCIEILGAPPVKPEPKS